MSTFSAPPQSRAAGRRRRRIAASAFVALAFFSGGDAAAEGALREIRMVNQGSHGRFVFEPNLLRIEPGDRVRFSAIDPGHGSQSIPGMAPEGGPDWRTGIGREVEVTFDVEGIYGFKCRAHYATGMVGLIVVGDPAANLDEARSVRHPEGAHLAFEALFAALDGEEGAGQD